LLLVDFGDAPMGAVTGKGLADLIRENFGVRLTIFILIGLLIADIGNTVAEFGGVASSMHHGCTRCASQMFKNKIISSAINIVLTLKKSM